MLLFAIFRRIAAAPPPPVSQCAVVFLAPSARTPRALPLVDPFKARLPLKPPFNGPHLHNKRSTRLADQTFNHVEKDPPYSLQRRI